MPSKQRRPVFLASLAAAAMCISIGIGNDIRAAEEALPSPHPPDAPALTNADLQKLIDLAGTVGSLKKCRPAICAFFGLSAKQTSNFSQIRCVIPSGSSVAFATLNGPSDGYLFFLNNATRHYVYAFHSDAHLKLLAAMKTGSEDSGNEVTERVPDEFAGKAFAIATNALSRCMQDPFGFSSQKQQ